MIQVGDVRKSIKYNKDKIEKIQGDGECYGSKRKLGFYVGEL